MFKAANPWKENRLGLLICMHWVSKRWTTFSRQRLSNVSNKKKVVHFRWCKILRTPFLLANMSSQWRLQCEKNSFFVAENLLYSTILCFLYLWHFLWELLVWVKSFAIYCCVLISDVYITWPKQFKPWKIFDVVGSIVVVGALTLCTLLRSISDLKASVVYRLHDTGKSIWSGKVVTHVTKLLQNLWFPLPKYCTTFWFALPKYYKIPIIHVNEKYWKTFYSHYQNIAKPLTRVIKILQNFRHVLSKYCRTFDTCY